MDLGLDGKVAIVTGSTKGIGRGIAEALSREGARVVVNGRSESQAAAVAEALANGAIGVSADVSTESGCHDLVEAALESCGKIDVLVCNVGSGRSVPPLEGDRNEWLRVLDVNLLSTTNMVQAAQKLIKESQGSITAISSICGLRALGAPATYSASKAALNSYVENIARPLGAFGVRVNAIAPGNILFEGSVWERKLREDENAVHDMLEAHVPMNCLGTPEDVAGLACFLSSEQARFITGSVFRVDGGQL